GPRDVARTRVHLERFPRGREGPVRGAERRVEGANGAGDEIAGGTRELRRHQQYDRDRDRNELHDGTASNSGLAFLDAAQSMVAARQSSAALPISRCNPTADSSDVEIARLDGASFVCSSQ